MFERLKDALGQRFQSSDTAEETEDQRVARAAAMLLLEVAWADHVIEHQEIDLIRSSLKSLYGIEDSSIDEIVDDAKRRHEDATDIHPLTRILNEELDLDERRHLLVALWKLNDCVDSEFHYAESVIRRIANLLYLSHSDFISAKLSARSAN